METEKKYALLIDADNVSPKYMDLVLRETKTLGDVSIRRIYGDWTEIGKHSWKECLLENSLTPIQQYSYTTGKNASDSAMIIDAMDILYTREIDGFVIVSSDSDFTKLAMRLRESGKYVVGMGESKTPSPFVKACDRFKTLDILMRSVEEIPKKGRNVGKSYYKRENNNIAELQKQLDSARQLNTSSLSAPASDLVREAKLEAGKILADARLYAESAEKELKQQADSQKNRMAENARSIASGVMLVRERLARVDERLSAATLDLDGLTQAIYQALDQTEAELKELGTDMRSFAQGTPETDPPAPLPPRPAAAQTPAAKPADRLRVKAKKAQPAHHTPPAPAHRLRNTRRPVSQLLQDQIDRLNGEEQ